ncbi:MAG: hypothetical protein ACJ8D8_10820 [Microvirga sp.]|nr:hypothetical protein [Beijerinckiaceae bacterium]
MDRVLHTIPPALAPLLRGLAARPDRPDCWYADVDVGNEELKALNLFEGSARHGRVCFTLPGTGQLAQGEMNSLLGLGTPAGGARPHARVRVSFHDVKAEP